MANVPQKKGRAMVRTVMTAWAMILAVATIAVTQDAYAQGRGYGDPPVTFTQPPFAYQGTDGNVYVRANGGENDPYMYDMHTSMQASYWGAVVDNLASKISSEAADITAFEEPDEVWDFLEEKNIRLDEQEAKVMCLFLRSEDDEPTEEVVPNWPEDGWPTCGGVLDVMFGGSPGTTPGRGFPSYIVGQDDDRKEIAQYLLSSMGIDANQIEATVNAAAGQDTGNDTFSDEAPDDTLECYTPSNNIQRYEVGGCGVLCTVTKIIMGLLNSASMAIVNATAGNTEFQSAVLAALTLYVTIYGAMVVLGLVNVALGDALVRVAKLAVVAMVLSSETIMTLFHMIRCFFIEGTTYLIHAVMQVGLEAVVNLGAAGEVDVYSDYIAPAPNNDLCGTSFSDTDSATGPLVILEALLTQVFSAHMLLTLITLMLSKVYGFLLGIFLIFGLIGFVMALLKAVTVYLTALIAQYLLLSLLPIFIVFVLFEKTKHLFDGWINQLVTYSLTPIFLFAYISLFVVVVSASLAQILDVRICWAKWFTIAWVFDITKPFFFEWGVPQPMVDTPFGFFEVLIFVLLVFLMKEFEDSVEALAQDIGNSYVYVNRAANQLQGWFKGKGNQMKSKAVQTVKAGGGKALTAGRGGIGGHQTQSSSGQRGVSGAGGAKQSLASKAAKTVTRKGGGGS